MIEWFVAHCGTGNISPLLVMMANTVVNGSSPSEIDPIREQFRSRIINHYGNQEAACAGLKEHLASQ